MSEELVYYSAATPAIIPARCVPEPGVLMPPDCSTANIPIYQHRLVWFFISNAVCQPYGVLAATGPQPVLRSNPCIGFTDVDATTGAQGFGTTG